MIINRLFKVYDVSTALVKIMHLLSIRALFRDFFAILKPLGIMGEHSSEGEHNQEPFVRYIVFRQKHKILCFPTIRIITWSAWLKYFF